MNSLVFDVETTTSNRGNPFDADNRCVAIGYKESDEDTICFLVSDGFNQKFQDAIDKADILVGFNIKFDLSWIRNIGYDFSGKYIWDCQLGEFILSNQNTRYPSLNGACEKYGLPVKIDVVKTEYWDKGINTDSIPTDILFDYLKQDVELTYAVYLKQHPALHNSHLFKLHCLDLLVLQEMEYNGIVFDKNKAADKSESIKETLLELKYKFSHMIGTDVLSITSNDHVSCALFGGTITIEDRVPVGVFKTGAKAGQTRYKVLHKEYAFKRRCNPIKEVAKEGFFSVDEETLVQLKANRETKEIISCILEYRRLNKLMSTYLDGWSNLIDTMHWDKIHGSLNQCVVITGRLSSSNPNLQNADPETKKYCVSRYDN